MGDFTLAGGTVLGGDFRLERPLSSGGMGAVYIATQLSTGARRAVKVMRAELLGDAKLRERFEQEARVGAQIPSDHIAQVLTAGVDEALGVPFLAMELLDGAELGAIVRSGGPLSLSAFDMVLGQLCHALGAAHALGIVHRDLKPANVIVAKSRTAGSRLTVKVLDFGIAKLLADAQTKSTQAMGTPLWFAPEQSARKASVTAATDVWALGLLGFYLLSGRVYWESGQDEDTSSLEAIMREILIDPLDVASARARALGVTFPEWLDAWFGRCVARNPDERYPTAREAHAAFAQAARPRLDSEGAYHLALDQFATLIETATGPAPFGPTLAAPAPGSPRPLGTQVAPPPQPLETLAPKVPQGQHAPAPRGPQTVEWEAPQEIPSGPNGSVDTKVLREAWGAAPATAPRSHRLQWGVAIGALAVVSAFGVAVVKNSASGPPVGSSAPPSSESVAPLPARIAPPAPESVALPPGMALIPAHGSQASFSMDKTEVTVTAYDACVSAGGCTTPDTTPPYCNEGVSGRGNHPINCVDWAQATKYCASVGKRLPTEEEWQYAAQGDDGHEYPWGNAAPGNQLCWNGEGSTLGKGKRQSTCAVGSFPSGNSPFGLSDMSGNVWEWTSSKYDDNARVSRGGCWDNDNPSNVRAAIRYRDAPSSRDINLGFRCSR